MTEIAPHVQVNTYPMEQRIRALELSAIATADAIEKRINKIEADRLQAEYSVVVDESEKRIATIEDRIEDRLGNHIALGRWVEILEERIAALEKALSEEACAPGRELLREFNRRIAALEDKIK